MVNSATKWRLYFLFWFGTLTYAFSWDDREIIFWTGLAGGVPVVTHGAALFAHDRMVSSESCCADMYIVDVSIMLRRLFCDQIGAFFPNIRVIEVRWIGLVRPPSLDSLKLLMYFSISNWFSCWMWLIQLIAELQCLWSFVIWWLL